MKLVNFLTDSTHSRPKRLFSKGFSSLLIVSFFGAANDNILKQFLTLMVVVGGVWANCWGPGTQGYIFLVLTVPFVLLSGWAGQIADKYSKQSVILFVKTAEIPIALIAMTGLYLQSFWISLFALFLLAIQSSFYGPAKFGIIPTLVGSEQLSKANGLINATTNLAIILGSMAAGPLTAMYYPTMSSPAVNQEQAIVEAIGKVDAEGIVKPVMAGEIPKLIPDPARKPRHLPIGIALVVVSVCGLISACLMPRTLPVDPDLKLSYDFFGPHLKTLSDASHSLLVVLFSWSGFYLVGSLALLLLPEYQGILGLQPTQITALVGLLAVSVVMGSCAVGFLSGKTIRPYFSLTGAIGMAVGFGAMGVLQLSYEVLACLIFLIGFFAGFYIVPLQSLLQYLAPSDERGQFFGTANTLSFSFTAMAGVIFIGLSVSGISPARVPLFCSALAAVGTVVGAVELNRITKAQRKVASAEEAGPPVNQA